MNVPMPPPVPGNAPSLPPAPPIYVASAPARPTSTAAVVSLISGLLSWVLLPFVGSIVAVIAGHMARSEIRRSNGAMDGDGLAVAGMVLGYLQLGLTLLTIIGIILFFGGLLSFAALSQ